MGYKAGGWRVERHPRFLADTTGDGRRDIVGFGNDGVWVSRAAAASTAPSLVVDDLGYNAGGWRVERTPLPRRHDRRRTRRHRRLRQRRRLGSRGHCRAAASRRPELVIEDLGYNAGGWRVERHPRLLGGPATAAATSSASATTASGSRAHCRSSAFAGRTSSPSLGDLGYHAGGWRVDRHPPPWRTPRATDVPTSSASATTASGLRRAVGRGGFGAPQFVMPHYGYDAGHWVVPGWPVESHPRLLADMTGDRRADILGFGAGGAYLSSL